MSRLLWTALASAFLVAQEPEWPPKAVISRKPLVAAFRSRR